MNDSPKKLYLTSALTNKCPRCRDGKIFKYKNAYNLKHFLDMNEACPTCNQPTEIEVGFYYGTGYVSYALSIAFFVSTAVAWSVLFGLSFSDNSIFYWLVTAIALILILQPVLMRLSRSLWLSWFVKYDPNWKKNPIKSIERTNKKKEDNN